MIDMSDVLNLVLILAVVLKVVDISMPAGIDIAIIVLAVLNVLLIGIETFNKKQSGNK